MSSAMWTQSPISECFAVDGPAAKLQVEHQCRHGAKIETGQKAMKPTGDLATWPLRHTAVRCQCVKPHGVLQDSVNGVKRTHLAAVYTYHRCRAVIRDVCRRLRAHQKRYARKRGSIGDRDGRRQKRR